jgi:hypothetical protein
MKPLLTILTLATIFFAQTTYAQETRLPVNADGTLEPEKGFVSCSGSNCSACDFVVLGNTAIKWLITISFLFFAVLAFRAGIKLVTSQGNAGALSEAKSSFTNAFIGLIIILLAFLIVDTIMRQLVKGNGTIEGYGPWSQVQCSKQVEPELKREQFAGDEQFEAAVRNLAALRTNPGNCQPDPTGPCSESALRSSFGSNALSAAIILGAESGCNPSIPSSTDGTTDGRSYSIGLWQINLAAHDITCNGETLDCTSAFRYAGYRNRFNVRVMRIENEDMYRRCVAAASNPQCNSAKAAELFRASGNDFDDWACSATKCGIPTSVYCQVPGIRG